MYPRVRGGGTESAEISVLLAIDKWIYSFHMALFFFISGYLQSISEKKGYGWENIKKKLISIIGPYIFFSIVFWLFKKAFAGSISNPVSLRDLLLIGVFPLSDLWFLYALAVFYIIRVVIIRLRINENFIFITAILISLISMAVEWDVMISNTALPRICKYLSFYCGGAIFKRDFKKTVEIKKYLLYSIVMLLCGITGLYASNHCSGIWKAMIQLIIAWLNIFAFVMAGMILNSKFLQFFGMRSLYVFLVHDYAVCAVVIVVRRFLSSPSVMTALATVGGLLISVFVIWICTRVKLFDYCFKPQLLFKYR